MSTTPPVWTRAYWSAYLLWHLRQQARVPFLPPQELVARRDRRMHEMVAYAYRWTSFYRETMQGLGLTPDDFTTADDLRRLPIVDTRLLQDQPERLRSRQFGDGDLLRAGSGGSTGQPHGVWHNTAALLQSAAHSRRDNVIASRLIGKAAGYRQLVLGSPRGTGPEVREFTRQKALYPPREPIERLAIPLSEPPEATLPRINAFQPDIIRGYGSYFGRLFSYIRDHDLPFHRPKVIVYSSEGVPSAAQRIIREDFGIPLFGLYQAIEAFKMGFECEAHRGYHINVDNYVLRVVNDAGDDLPPGETGEVLVSNLVNRGTVLLNMRLNDMARWLPPEPCACGRTLPLLDFVLGRSQEWIKLPDGVLLHPQLLATVLYDLGDIHRFQGVQLAPDLFEVRLVPVAGADLVALAARAQGALQSKVGTSARYKIRFVDELTITASGKMRAVIGLGGDGLTPRP